MHVIHGLKMYLSHVKKDQCLQTDLMTGDFYKQKNQAASQSKCIIKIWNLGGLHKQ